MTDLSDVYPKGWAAQWSRVSKDCLLEDSPIFAVQNGSTHTLAVSQKGKIFAWGWNDNGQCAKPEEFAEILASTAKQANIFL